MELQKISVIVPVYNVAPYLRRCVNSLVKQTYPNLEIILIDDGSTDGSETICDEYAAQYAHIIAIHQKNAGQAVARNAGIEIASGEWIGFLDSDDWIEETMYETLIVLAHRYETDLASCATQQITVDGKVLSVSNTGIIHVLTPDEMIAGLVTQEIVRYEVWNKLWKRSLIGDVRFIGGQLGEEVHFDRLLFLKANKMVHIDLSLHNYLVRRPGSTASAFRPARLCIFNEFDALVQELEKDEKNELSDAVRRIASTFACDIYFQAIDTKQNNEILTQLLQWFRYFYRGKKTDSKLFKKIELKIKLFNFSPRLTLILRKIKKTLLK